MKKIIALLLLLSPYIGYTEPVSLPVEVVSAHWQEYARPIRLSGILENKSEQNLAFKVSGLVQSIDAYEGQWVQAGQILASLDLEEINAQVTKAQALLANAEQNLARFTSLRGQNALSLEQLQSAQTQVDVVRSDLTVAKFNQRHAVIRAPADGRVLKRFIENNEMVALGTPAFLFAPKKSGWVMRAGVTDKDIVRLQVGDSAEVSVDAYPGVIFSARVNELAARADATQTFGLELSIEEQQDSPLLAGFIGFAQVTPSHTRKIMLLPAMAMVRAERTAAVRKAGIHSEVDVFIVVDGVAQLRRLPLLAIEQGNLVVAAGLQEGDQVVTSGAAWLSAGTPVSITPLVAQ